MFDLFGSEMPLPAKFFIAFAAVLALIALTAWVVRRFGANRLGGGNARGRQPRLAVIDAATVDGRRRLVLIRRDNVEHLLMIGGPTDVVVEPNIVRAAPSREAPRAADPTLRQSPPVENGWPLQPASEPTPVAAPRPYRATATEEPWLAPEPGARPRPAETGLANLAAELPTRHYPEPMPPAAAARHEPPRAAAPPVMPAEPVVQPQTDHNLAAMAQQLEAALRRTPPVPENRPPATDALAMPAAPAVKVPEVPVSVPGRDYKLRVDPQFVPRQEPKFEPHADGKTEPAFDPRMNAKPDDKSAVKAEPKLDFPPKPRFEAKPEKPYERRVEPKVESSFEPKAEPTFEPQVDAKFEPKFEPNLDTRPQPAADSVKTAYDSLEEEMANLLGRQPGKT